MKLLIIMMMFTTVNSYSQTLKQIALSKLESNNKYEAVKTGLIDRGINCNSSLKDDDGINNPNTADAIRYTAYRYEECYTRADTSLEFVGNYEEDWAQPAPVPVVSPVAVKDTAVLWSTQEATVSTSTVAPSTVLVKDKTYVSSDREIAATDYKTQELNERAQEPTKDLAEVPIIDTGDERPTMDTGDERLLDQPLRKK